MRLLLLPGNTKHDKTWMQKVAISFLPFSQSVSMHNYDHWFSNDSFDIKKEMEFIARKNTHYSGLVLVAKCEGVILGLEAIRQGKINPMACVFIDSPKNVKNFISEFELPMLQTSGKNISKLIKTSRLFLSNID